MLVKKRIFFCVDNINMEKRQNIKREIKAIRKIFNNNHDCLSRNEINRIRTNLYKKQLIYDFLKLNLI